MLNIQQRRFALEYTKDSNATQSAIRAGYSEDSAGQIGHMLLKNIEIQAVIQEHFDDAAAAAGITVQGILRRYWQIANADANELIQIRRCNCRHCHGEAGHYQWTMNEFIQAVESAKMAGREPPLGIGGFDFNPMGDPNPDCTECRGEGVEVIHTQDSRHLKGSAKLLYAGVQKTKDGIKVLTRDQDGALAALAKYMGMTTERKEISGPGGGPIPMATLKAEDLTDDQLAALLGMNDDTDQS